ncbi:transmembrane protein 81 isoform X1 [Xiphophorus couchianus]|uniref:transmembrane protein 81 isoform X1 n=1 Tax=Xiphophorus couchianus TaxID=32473 RepID=UPI001017052A|nr:transmembrane protein 81 isoform X1 [Xiphophorus couchianus]XP_027865795.1 transmembrane protein 81 isoform X1 [Xiphophorus couchianus]XP_027865796.1 transmembrane protein 81 isoform X1 [Xiphophorus couchianus]
MHVSTVTLHFLLFLHLLLPVDMEEEEDKVPLEVITESSPCSMTCGLGVKTQTLCLLKDGKAAMENTEGKEGSKSSISKTCRSQQVQCVESWQCGLKTMTVTSGQRVEIDCLGEVMAAMGAFSWRVSWRYARGVISSDDSLFDRWKAPDLHRVVLDPVREKDAGTYRCDVQDTNYRRRKTVYWGVRVLPAGVVNLDYQSSLSQWDVPGRLADGSGVLQLAAGRVLLYAVVICFILTGFWIGLIFLYKTVRCRRQKNERKTEMMQLEKYILK